jgi:folate-binding protein YgfZ
MTPMTPEIKIAKLPDRGVVAVEGPDAGKLLQGLLTNDLALLEAQPAMHAGLLSPQGKILFDFFVVRSAGGFLLDVAREKAAELVKRLTLYKLRAAVTITDVSNAYVALALWGPHAWSSGETIGTVSFADPRHPEMGLRILAEARFAADISLATNGLPAEAAAYHAHRIGLGIPEGGKDYAFGDAFPHEALFDQLHGVSFSKGCYVGQEIVSRMEHRGTARRRIVPVLASGGPLVSGVAILAGEAEIGRVGSVAGSRGLAALRLDRVDEFAAKGVALAAGEATVTVALPPWAHFKPMTSQA